MLLVLIMIVVVVAVAVVIVVVVLLLGVVVAVVTVMVVVVVVVVMPNNQWNSSQTVSRSIFCFATRTSVAKTKLFLGALLFISLTLLEAVGGTTVASIVVLRPTWLQLASLPVPTLILFLQQLLLR